MKIATLSANLGSFDTTPQEPVRQDLPFGLEMAFHRFTDEDFPPITGLTGRFQYRIPKLFGWEMFPGYDFYIWLDSSMSLQRADSVRWLMKQLGGADAAFFAHPWRSSVKEEAEHIEKKLQENNKYIVPRYKNGLHKEMYDQILRKEGFVDNNLFASTVFVYANTRPVHALMKTWWYYQSRYYTCDQLALPLAIHNTQVRWPLLVNKIPDNLFESDYISLVSKH